MKHEFTTVDDPTFKASDGSDGTEVDVVAARLIEEIKANTPLDDPTFDQSGVLAAAIEALLAGAPRSVKMFALFRTLRWETGVDADNELLSDTDYKAAKAAGA
jgi:hypothetical protein